jgi:multisubunit Na+/H+ antiporter MnhG subunit
MIILGIGFIISVRVGGFVAHDSVSSVGILIISPVSSAKMIKKSENSIVRIKNEEMNFCNI